MAGIRVTFLVFYFCKCKKKFFWGQSLLFIYCMCALVCPCLYMSHAWVPTEVRRECKIPWSWHYKPLWVPCHFSLRALKFLCGFQLYFWKLCYDSIIFFRLPSPFPVPSVYSEGVSYFSSSLWLQSGLFSPHWQKSIVAMFKDKLPELVCQRLFSLCWKDFQFLGKLTSHEACLNTHLEPATFQGAS